MTRRGSISRLIGLSLLLLSPAVAAEQQEERIADPRLARLLANHVPTPLVLPELAVDTDSDRRLVVPRTCEAEGEAALVRLARTSAVEEAFAFVPDLCVWVDVGSQQTASAVRVNRRILDDLAMEFGRIVVYHIHPLSDNAGALYFPAYSDLLGVILINAKHRPHQAVEIIHRAVTPAGAVEYSYHPSDQAEVIIGVINQTGLLDFAGENLSMSYRAPEYERIYYDAIRDCTAAGTSEERFAGCFPLVAGDFLLEYRANVP